MFSMKTETVAVIVMFIMFFIGDFSPVMNLDVYNTLQYFSTWFYYDTTHIFGTVNYVNLARDMLLLATINIALIASLYVLRKRDIQI
jgi:hypothetical protein